MAQHDYDIANQSGASFRSDLNLCLDAIQSTNSGSSQPSSRVAYMLWANTTASELQLRDGANSAWQGLFTFAGNINRPLSVGTSAPVPSSYNSNYDDLVVYQSSGNGGITIATGSSATGGIAFAQGTSGTSAYTAYIQYNQSVNQFEIGAEAATRVFIGGGGRLGVIATQSDVLILGSTNASGTSNRLISGKYSGTEAVVNSGTECFVVYTNGDVKNTNNSYTGLSDIKLKENVVDASSQWDDIKGIRVRKYNFKEGQTHTQIGVIAQEVEQISPGLVFDSPDLNKDGEPVGTVTKNVNYSVLYMKAVKALQEAMDRIETLEAKVAALEAA